jgi:hypothetical protein
VRWTDRLRRAETTTGTALALVTVAVVCLAAPRAAVADERVYACGYLPNEIFQAYSPYGITAQATCPGGGLTLAADVVGLKQGQNALWQAVAPEGLEIVTATVPPGALQSNYVNAGSDGDYGGDFYWTGGSSNITPSEGGASFTGLASPDFGIQLVCGKPTCSGANYFANINVAGVILIAHETSGPVLTAPSGLWQTTGWIRGEWPLAFSGDSPSGMCLLTASLASQALPGTSSPADIAAWHQCAAAAVDDPVYTSDYPQGADTLQIGGTDAAGVPAAVDKTIEIDNQQPIIELSGPGLAASTAGTQYVAANAFAGPSGVAGIDCSVDGAPSQWYPSNAAQVPVSGVGQHQVQCDAQNNAVDATGAYATSVPQTFSMTIGTPAVNAITFSTLIDQLRCRHVTERVRVPAQWVKVKVHGSVIRVHERPHTIRVKETKCHARTVRQTRTVWTTVRRHGKRVRVRRRETVRVVVLPHVVDQTQRRVAHGHTTVVNGWLGTDTGVALAGQPVEVLTAPDNGTGDFTPTATTTTAADGAWSATLPAGPSRLIEADYGGATDVLPALSAMVRETVPAEITLTGVSPRRVAWGGTVRLTGRLNGGYLPSGGALVRLRIGQGKAVTTYGVREHVIGNGRFSTTYTFGAGDPATYRSFWFQVASLPMGDYPYTPADSRRIAVTVGGHP